MEERQGKKRYKRIIYQTSHPTRSYMSCTTSQFSTGLLNSFGANLDFHSLRHCEFRWASKSATMRELHLQTLEKAIKGISPMIVLTATSRTIFALSRAGIRFWISLQLLIILMAETHLIILYTLWDKVSSAMLVRMNIWGLTGEDC